ncbi:MAG: AMP-binding protein, partial [Firmicutes bacterium]|nr:AMP-binding protein [Bacillota bacterium]
INPKVIEDFQALGFPMIQGYGMSENGPIISVNRDRYSKPASVGQPLPGTKVKVIDKDERGIGEIIVKGPSIMLGYYENPEATAEAIRDGWLYTGDYGYMDSDGYLYISGRKKNVIVTKNGKNIFPEEIEALLSETEYIAECLVHGVPDEKSGDTIVKAEVYPDYNLIRSDLGNLTEAEIERLMNRLVDDVNDKMPAYKRVARVGVRKTEFEKTTTRNVKRHTQGNLGPQ